MSTAVLAALMALAAPLALSALARRTRASLRPDWTAFALVAAMVVVATATVTALGTMAWPLVARIGPVAGLGHWSRDAVGSVAPVPTAVSVLAAGAAALVVGRMATTLLREARALHAAAPGEAGEELTVVDDAVPFAHAVYGWRLRPNRLVLSRGLLESLDHTERQAVLAHERAHLHGHHAVLSLAAALSADVNPLLRWCRPHLDCGLARWADEAAAAATDRATVARAVGRTALARMHELRVAGAAPLGLGGSAVPARVDALLTPPRDNRLRHTVGYAALVLAAAVLVVTGLNNIEDLVEVLRLVR